MDGLANLRPSSKKSSPPRRSSTPTRWLRFLRSPSIFSARFFTRAPPVACSAASPSSRRFGAVAQFEREMMLERQREGIAKAKNEGKYKGRAPTARAKSAEIIRLAGEGMTREGIAEKLGVGVASVYRALAAARQ
jgi:Helix-turn-helix domain of resolvase